MSFTMRGMLMLVTVLLMSCTIHSYENESIKKRSTNRRQRPRPFRNRLAALRRQQLNMQNSEGALDWSRLFVPDVPNADEVDCNIEVEVTEVIGGRCVRLGGVDRMAVCQSGMYLDVHSETCGYIMAQREMNSQFQELNGQNTDPSEQSQSVAGNNAAENAAENGVAGNNAAENGVAGNNAAENSAALNSAQRENTLTDSQQMSVDTK